jgi:hypothetical protein
MYGSMSTKFNTVYIRFVPRKHVAKTTGKLLPSYTALHPRIQEYFFKFVASCCLKPFFNQNLHEQFTEHLSVMGSEVIREGINHQQDSPWIYIKSLQDARLLVNASLACLNSTTLHTHNSKT